MSTLVESVGGFSGFKMRLLMVGLLIIAGGMFWQIGRNVSHGKGASFALSPDGGWAFGSAKKTATLTKADRWGAAMVRMGITFVGAMLLGGLTRAYFKPMLSLLVMSILVMVFLNYKGMMEPFWEPYLRSSGGLKQWFFHETKSVTHFLQGAFIPAALGMTGFILGLRR